jgi:hypothetical protein
MQNSEVLASFDLCPCIATPHKDLGLFFCMKILTLPQYRLNSFTVTSNLSIVTNLHEDHGPASMQDELICCDLVPFHSDQSA